jgi:malonate-semialdehyde dehydrogenase (acetylating)/methylmalonate-semialdehyde dehydrogenase
VPLSARPTSTPRVTAARAAFPEWRRRPTIERARWLFGFRQVMEAHADELARSVTREMGKTLPDARAEVGRAIEMVEAASAIPQTMQGRILENVATGVDCETIRQPVGVCAARSCPFNFPANGAVLVPAVRDRLREHVRPEAVRAGAADPGALLQPDRRGRRAARRRRQPGERLGRRRERACSTTRASTRSPSSAPAKVARYIYERAAANGKRVQALGGAKNFMVVMPDAVMPKTVSNIIGSAFGAPASAAWPARSSWPSATQAPLLDELVARTEELSVGDGLEQGTDVGPVVSCAARDRIAEWIERGVDGARRCRRRPRPDATPRARSSARRSSTASRRTWTSPARRSSGRALGDPRGSLDEAIDDRERSRYGNGTSIFTESGAAVRRYRHDVEVGMIGVNVGVAAPVAFFPVLRVEGQLLRRPARPRAGRGRVLHAQEDHHVALLLGRRDGPFFVEQAS